VQVSLQIELITKTAHNNSQSQRWADK